VGAVLDLHPQRETGYAVIVGSGAFNLKDVIKRQRDGVLFRLGDAHLRRVVGQNGDVVKNRPVPLPLLGGELNSVSAIFVQHQVKAHGLGIGGQRLGFDGVRLARNNQPTVFAANAAVGMGQNLNVGAANAFQVRLMGLDRFVRK